MHTLRARFILSHILPIVIVVPFVGAALIYLLETQILLADLSQDIGEQASLIAQSVNERPDIWADLEQANAFVTSVSVHTSGYVSLIRPDGALIASSDPELASESGRFPESGQLDESDGVETALTGERSVTISYGFTRQSAEVMVPVVDVNERVVGIVGVTQSLEGVASQFGQLRWLVLIILAIELVVGVVVALILANRLARPIGAVSAAVGEIADGRRIDPIPEEGPDEVRQLAESVNQLAERLRVLEETRRRLLANLVHELGRPLGALRAAIHTLLRGADTDESVKVELLTGMEDEVKRMQPLLDDLAQLHGQVLGTLELARQPIVLGDWLPALLIPWRASALDKGLQWQATIPANLPEVNIDPDRIGQAIGNLVSNAIKYTPKGGSIDVSAGADKSEIWIRVSDSGPGIVPEEQQRVFEPFYRSRRPRRFPQGLGLGLTIAQDFVTAHGGRLELASLPGEGSRFTIRLPLNGSERHLAGSPALPG
jgi:two-component system sensor histidine kinase BaeS